MTYLLVPFNMDIIKVLMFWVLRHVLYVGLKIEGVSQRV